MLRLPLPKNRSLQFSSIVPHALRLGSSSSARSRVRAPLRQDAPVLSSLTLLQIRLGAFVSFVSIFAPLAGGQGLSPLMGVARVSVPHPIG